MKKDEIFFGENGLTSTSANHIANMAKEKYADVEKDLNTARFYTETIGLLGSNESNTLKEGVGNEFLTSIKDKLMFIAQLKSLIAWLREAIKAKQRVIEEATKLENSEIAKALGIEEPERPVVYPRITEDDVVASWGIKQRNRYYYLDTLCSTIGKYIHPDHQFSNAKEELLEILHEKHKASGSGRDTVIYTRTPSVDVENVNTVFFDLQNDYRGYQAELNSMKHSIETTIQADDREKTSKELLEARDYNAKMQDFSKNVVAYQKDRIAEAQNLKIIIPDSLKAVYEEINNLGK